MNKEELREEFKKETNIDNLFYTDKSDFSITYFKDEYVKWLEEKLIEYREVDRWR
jgi:hypothetical protein